jgi:hypothetical protein
MSEKKDLMQALRVMLCRRKALQIADRADKRVKIAIVRAPINAVICGYRGQIFVDDVKPSRNP